MYAASATRTNAGIAARQGAVPVTTPNLHLVNSGLRLTITRQLAEIQALKAKIRTMETVHRDAGSIIEEMAERYSVPAEMIKSAKRGNRRVSLARHHAQYEIMRLCPAMSFKAIAEIFGQDHSTVIYAVSNWPKKAAYFGIPCQPLPPINLPVVKGYTPEASHG